MSDTIVSWVAVVIGLAATGAALWSALIAKQSAKEEADRRREERRLQDLERSFNLKYGLNRDYFQDPYLIHYRRGAAIGILKGEYSLELENLMDFLERVGEAVSQNILDAETADNSFGGRIMRYWCASEPYIREERSRMKDPHLWIEVERSYNRFVSMRSKKLNWTVDEVIPNPAVIERFLRSEASLPITVDSVPQAILDTLPTE